MNNYIKNDQQKDIEKLLDLMGSYIEDENKVITEIYRYYMKHRRHRYSYIAEYVNNRSTIDKEYIEFLLYNIQYIIQQIEYNNDTLTEVIKNYHNNYFQNNKELSKEDFSMKLEKLYDHIALERERITYSQKRKDEIVGSSVEKINKAMNEFTNTFNKKTENLNTSVLTIIGLFSAIIFVFFGGLSNLTSAISALSNGKNLWNILLAISEIGLIIFNSVFLLLYSVSKMTDKNIGKEISNKSYYRYRYIHYWDVVNKRLGFYSEPNKFTLYQTGQATTVEQAQDFIIKQAKVKAKIISFLQYICNFFIYVYCKLCNTMIIKSIRRFPFVAVYNIIMLILALLFYAKVK
ncbi:hypothetical protein FDC58_16810 [Clostridium botulinum]|nr:hypothetical protein [Clostridium botulinum]NFP30854.1 hypothetical protein [Clostridium botulinum]